MIKRLYVSERNDPSYKKDFWKVVRNLNECIDEMEKNGCPDFISVANYGLLKEGLGFETIKWMITKDIEMEFKWIPTDFTWNVREDSAGLLEEYIKKCIDFKKFYLHFNR